MVKNTHGGSKHKGLARKLVNAPISAKPRLSECDDECYALVTKMLGNGMCHVNLSHKGNIIQNVVCHIRGKFRERNKKNNLVQIANFVLVGLRTWDSTIKHCDLMFTFSNSHIHSIPFDLQSLNIDYNIHLTNDDLFSNHSSNILDSSLLHVNSATYIHPDIDIDIDTDLI